MKFLQLIALTLFVASTTHLRAADDAKSSEELSRLPADCIGFTHVRVADLWKSESMKDVRDILAKAGEKTLQAFDQRFTPNPSTIDRFTGFIVLKDKKEMEAGFIVLLNKPMNREQFVKLAMPAGKEVRTAKGSMIVDEKTKFAATFIDDKLFIAGSPFAVKSALDNPGGADKGPMGEAVSAAKRYPIVVGLKAMALPTNLVEPLFKNVPEESVALLGMESALLTYNPDEGDLKLKVNYPNAAAKKKADEALKALVKMGLKEIAAIKEEFLDGALGNGKPAPLSELPEAAIKLAGVAGMAYIEEILKDLPISHDETSMTLNVKVPSFLRSYVGLGVTAVALMVQSVQKLREATAQLKSSNNLKYLGIGMHNYESVYQHLPSAAICNAKGKPMLSWRVAILPYIEQQKLYEQFKLDEPWDSDHNKKLIEKMPAVFKLPEGGTDKTGMTHYRTFVGRGAMFNSYDSKSSLVTIADGTSNTFMIIESTDAVIWTKPDEIPFGDKIDLPKPAKFHRDGFLVCFGDGSVMRVKSTIKPDVLRAFITANGGEFPIMDDVERPNRSGLSKIGESLRDERESKSLPKDGGYPKALDKYLEPAPKEKR